MRLVGLSKKNFVAMIFVQSYLFVLPAVLLGFSLYYPVIKLIFSSAFSEDMGYMPDCAPSVDSITQALLLGLIIPALSAIIPI